MFSYIPRKIRLIHTLVATLAFISDSVGADDLPKRIRANTLFAQMDGQIYKSGKIQIYDNNFCPSWMTQPHILEGMAEDVFYLRQQSSSAFGATLSIDHSEATGSSSHPPDRTPVSVKVHIEKNYRHIHYKAVDFRIDQFTGNGPRKSYIYIARRGGLIYSAPMIDITPYTGPHPDHPHFPHSPIVQDGLPLQIPNNNILVLMDGKTYKTDRINVRHNHFCPFWLQQGQFLNMIDRDSFYVRPVAGFTYEGTLSYNYRYGPSEDVSDHSAPTSVRIHLVEIGYHTYQRAGIFELVNVPHKERAEHATHEYPPGGFVYVARKGGPVYRASLIEFSPPPGLIPKNKSLHLAMHV